MMAFSAGICNSARLGRCAVLLSARYGSVATLAGASKQVACLAARPLALPRPRALPARFSTASSELAYPPRGKEEG